jgi:general transcription factor IIIA
MAKMAKVERTWSMNGSLCVLIAEKCLKIPPNSTNIAPFTLERWVHIRKLTFEKPFLCEDCGKRFSRKEHCQRHARTHSQDPSFRFPFKCTVEGCDRAFNTRQHLNEHIDRHSTPKPHKCTHEGCDESFSKHKQLHRHLCEHEGKLPYPCTHPGCDQSFPNTQRLNRHLGIHNRKFKSNC